MPIIKNITISEKDAKDAIIHVAIKRDGQEDSDTIFSIVFMKESEGSLYLEVCEDSNPSECITNNYPEFFTKLPKVQ